MMSRYYIHAKDTTHDARGIPFTYENDAGQEINTFIPCKFEVCPVCDGRGSIVNPSIDENGISPEEFDEDPDFREAYFSGRYDITCPDCHGLRVVRVPDEGKANPEVLKAYRDRIREEIAYEMECAAERRFCCGW